jgi:hypothetical protein
MPFPHRRCLFLLGIVCSSAVPAAVAQVRASPPGKHSGSRVIVVDDDGPADYASLPAAVAAAFEGSIVLVRDGRYDIAPELQIEGKALTLVADGPGALLVGGPIVVRNLGAAQHFVVDGLSVLPKTGLQGRGELLVLEDDAGTVWVEDCTFERDLPPFGSPSPFQGMSVRSCAALILARSSTSGGMSFSPDVPSGAGLSARGSSLFLFETHVRGGSGRGVIAGNAGDGGDGLRLDGGFLFGEGSTIEGGIGGSNGRVPFGGSGFAGDGGAGLRLVGLEPEALLADVELLGGMGGPALPPGVPGTSGPPSVVESGVLSELEAPGHTFELTSPVRAGESATASFAGVPGERVYYLVSSAPAASFQRPFLGPLVVARPYRKFFAGTLDTQGALTIAIPTELSAGSQVAVSYVQALFVDHGRSFTLSTPAVLTVLDPAY